MNHYCHAHTINCWRSPVLVIWGNLTLTIFFPFMVSCSKPFHFGFEHAVQLFYNAARS